MTSLGRIGLVVGYMVTFAIGWFAMKMLFALWPVTMNFLVILTSILIAAFAIIVVLLVLYHYIVYGEPL